MGNLGGTGAGQDRRARGIARYVATSCKWGFVGVSQWQ